MTFTLLLILCFTKGLMRQAWTLATTLLLGAFTSASALPLSAGDTIKVNLVDGEEFNGTYTIDLNGDLKLPYLAPIPAEGLEPSYLEASVERRLTLGELYRPGYAKPSISTIRQALISVFVKGAVFFPGQVTICVEG